MYVWRNIEARSCNNCCSGKAISITYSEYVFVALGIQYAMSMRRIILPCVAYPAVLYVSLISEKRHDFLEKKGIEHKKWVLIFSTISSYKISFWEECREIGSKMYFGLHVKYPLFFCDFNGTCFFFTDFRKILKYQISWKSVQWEPSFSMWTDGQRSLTKLMTVLLFLSPEGTRI